MLVSACQIFAGSTWSSYAIVTTPLLLTDIVNTLSAPFIPLTVPSALSTRRISAPFPSTFVISKIYNPDPTLVAGEVKSNSTAYVVVPAPSVP